MIRRLSMAIALAIGMIAFVPTSPAQASVTPPPTDFWVVRQYWYPDYTQTYVQGEYDNYCDGSTYSWGYHGGYEVDVWYHCS